jgi:glycosyltransferase involved in cell wall biosynthesis
VTTSMPVGGAETLLVNLVRWLDTEPFLPELCCLKDLGPLGEVLAAEIPTHSALLDGKFDLRVLPRLRALIKRQRIDAVITVGAGDKMFWGRLSAWLEGVPVILSALHSTGWPDTVGRLNRMLTPLTDAFIAGAESHGEYFVETERFPECKVRVIRNGIDVDHFRPRPEQRVALRSKLGLAASAPICGIVAALRPEKNHELFLRAAATVHSRLPEAHFLIVGDGPQRARLETIATEQQLGECVHFLGSRDDVPELLATMDVFALTSQMEANPVSILEALSTEVPVVATRVGSVSSMVRPGTTGYLAEPDDAETLARHWLSLLSQPEQARKMGQAGRALVTETSSLSQMVAGYQELINETYAAKFPIAKQEAFATQDSAFGG